MAHNYSMDKEYLALELWCLERNRRRSMLEIRLRRFEEFTLFHKIF